MIYDDVKEGDWRETFKVERRLGASVGEVYKTGRTIFPLVKVDYSQST